ncbi:MAG: DEAD/DEAH box helicase, partial [Phocaeicola sp.]|nr:DEAD/DEAH box helicase [Phocaeicola sp.]
QLERLESLAVKERGKIKISQFNTPLLDKTVNGVLSIGCDKQLNELKNNITKSLKQEPPVPAMLQAELRDYQYEGFRWMVRQTGWGAGVCLADDMGLGKTVQTIAFLLHRAQQGPSLVVAPASVIPNWCSELNRFAPALKISVLNKSTDRKALIAEATDNEVVLSTYGLLVNEEESLTDKAWNVVCLDEAHTIKNRDTKMSKVTMQLQASARLILTGTPIQNHLGELWNLFSFINPGLLGSYEQFHTKFIAPIEGSNDKERQLQLKRIVQPFMLRRTKAEVIEELPEKMEITIPVELSSEEMAAYEVIRRKAKSMLEEENRVSVSTLAEITKLRQAACSIALTNKKWKGDTTKIQILLDQIDEIKTGQNRMLIFSQFTSFLELVRKKLDERHEPYLYLDGNVSLKQREMLVKRFQNGECPLFLISLKAGGLGLNLTGANYVIHLDPWWNPAIEQQATDRAYRIGQERNVTVYRLIAQHTIEEKIVRLHHSKRDLADSLLEGADLAGKLTEKELMDMLTEN